MRIDRNLAVESGRFHIAIFKVNGYGVFVVKMHGSGFSDNPGVVPYDYLFVLENLFRTGPGKCERISAGVCYWSARMIFQTDHDITTTDVRCRAFGEEHGGTRCGA